MKCYIICKRALLDDGKYMEFSILEIYDKLKINLSLFEYDMTMVESAVELLVKSYYLDEINNKYIYVDN